jgi:hypothetical protein
MLSTTSSQTDARVISNECSATVENITKLVPYTCALLRNTVEQNQEKKKEKEKQHQTVTGEFTFDLPEHMLVGMGRRRLGYCRGKISK